MRKKIGYFTERISVKKKSFDHVDLACIEIFIDIALAIKIE